MAKYYKHPTFGHVYGQPVTSPIGRIVWPSLTKPKDPPPPKPGQQPGSPRYEVTLLLNKQSPTTEAFIKEITAMTSDMADLFNDKRSARLGEFKLLQDGDTMDPEKYPYYKGCWALVGRNVAQTDIVDAKKQPLDASGVIGGMKGRLVVTPLITAHGASYKLGAVQVTEDDGTRFGGGVRDMTSFLDACEPASETASAAAVDSTPVVEATPAKETKSIGAAGKGKTAALDLL